MQGAGHEDYVMFISPAALQHLFVENYNTKNAATNTGSGANLGNGGTKGNTGSGSNGNGSTNGNSGTGSGGGGSSGGARTADASMALVGFASALVFTAMRFLA